jgi:hypothetical protein
MLHLRCGDDILPAIAEAGLPGVAVSWCDPLCEGPVRAWPDEGARRAARRAWRAARYGEDPAGILRKLEAEDMSLASAAREDEVVLWFEADLFDQSILMYLLNRLAELAPDRTTLICIGSHPAHPGFIGLGQLETPEIAALFPTRVPVRPEQFETARAAMEVFGSGDPEAIWSFALAGAGALEFLGDALRRWLAELPSTRNGLSMTESLGLQTFAAGADTLHDAYLVAQRFESRRWMGDTGFYESMRLLALGPAPLIRPLGKLPRAGDPAFATMKFEVTDVGRAVIAGREDWFRVSGVSRWQGSVLLEAPRPAWRFDDSSARPVKTV